MKTLPTAEQRKNLAAITEWMELLVDCFNMQEPREMAHKEQLNRLAAEAEDLRESLKERDATIEKLLNGFAAIRVMLGIDKGVDLMNALAKRLNYKQTECEEHQPANGPVVVYVIEEWEDDE